MAKQCNVCKIQQGKDMRQQHTKKRNKTNNIRNYFLFLQRQRQQHPQQTVERIVKFQVEYKCVSSCLGVGPLNTLAPIIIVSSQKPPKCKAEKSERMCVREKEVGRAWKYCYHSVSKTNNQSMTQVHVNDQITAATAAAAMAGRMESIAKERKEERCMLQKPPGAYLCQSLWYSFILAIRPTNQPNNKHVLLSKCALCLYKTLLQTVVIVSSYNKNTDTFKHTHTLVCPHPVQTHTLIPTRTLSALWHTTWNLVTQILKNVCHLQFTRIHVATQEFLLSFLYFCCCRLLLPQLLTVTAIVIVLFPKIQKKKN